MSPETRIMSPDFFILHVKHCIFILHVKYCSSDHVIVFCAIKVFMVLSATNNARVIKISLLHYHFILYDLILILVSCDMSLVLGDMTLVSDDTILVSCDIRVSKLASQFFKF